MVWRPHNGRTVHLPHGKNKQERGGLGGSDCSYPTINQANTARNIYIHISYIIVSCFARKLQLVVFTWFQNYKVLSKTHTRNTNWFHENSALFHEKRRKQRARISTLIRALEKSRNKHLYQQTQRSTKHIVHQFTQKPWTPFEHAESFIVYNSLTPHFFGVSRQGMRGQGRVQDRVHKQVGKKREAQHRRQYTPHTQEGERHWRCTAIGYRDCALNFVERYHNLNKLRYKIVIYTIYIMYIYI